MLLPRAFEGTPPTPGIKTADVVDGFYSFLGFPRLISSGVVKKAIAKGIQDGFFAYYSGATPVLGSDGKYQVPLARVRSNAIVTEDEIDLESGFLMMPQVVPVATPLPEATGSGPAAPVGTPTAEPPLVLTSNGGPSDVQGTSSSSAPKSVEIKFSADRNQLFSAWNAIANLADLAGKVNVTVRADSAEGFDKGKLQNGVLEALRESDLIE
jgi:hypothetical protein